MITGFLFGKIRKFWNWMVRMDAQWCECTQCHRTVHSKLIKVGFPGASISKESAAVQESACNVGDLSLILGSERSPGEGNGNPLQYSCLEHPMDRGAWQATVYEITRVGHDLVTKAPPPPG